MTPDKTPSPTDAEAWALWTSLPLTGSAIQSQGEFARAVLAKWGSPVVAGEPVAIRAACSQIIKSLAAVVTAPQSDDQLDADLLPRDPVMRHVQTIRAQVDAIWKALPDVAQPTTPQPTQAQAGAVPQYRLLQPGVDRIEAADEFLSDDTMTWAIDPKGIFVGNIYGGRVLRPARRARLKEIAP